MSPSRHNAAMNQRAFTLIHMMVAIPLLATFLYIGSRLFISNNQLLLQAEADETRLLRTDQALHQLREDIWLSERLETNTRSVTVFSPSQAIVWQIDDNGVLTRTNDGHERDMVIRGIQAAQFAQQPGALTVSLGGETYLCPHRATGESHPEEVSP